MAAATGDWMSHTSRSVCGSSDAGASSLSASVTLQLPLTQRVPLAFQVQYLQANRPPAGPQRLPVLRRIAALRGLLQRRSVEEARRPPAKRERPVRAIIVDTSADLSIRAALEQQQEQREQEQQEPAVFAKIIPQPVPVQCPPQDYLERILREQGYSTQTYPSLETAYYAAPTKFQEASYSAHLIGLLRTDQIDRLERLLRCGLLSAHPCNAYGESILHHACRRGDARAVRALLAAGAAPGACDDYGRTPLHDACWAPAPALATAALLLAADPFLPWLADLRGAAPLSYVPRENWAAWNAFLAAYRDRFWPRDGAGRWPPPRALAEPNSRPLPEPPGGAVDLKVVAMVASGKFTPQEADLFLGGSGGDGDDDDDGAESTSTSSDDDDSKSDTVDNSAEEDEDEYYQSLAKDVNIARMVEEYMRFL